MSSVIYVSCVIVVDVVVCVVDAIVFDIYCVNNTTVVTHIVIRLLTLSVLLVFV